MGDIGSIVELMQIRDIK